MNRDMRDYVRLQTGKLLQHLASEAKRTADDTGAESIHDLRVAVRRLSRCLKVFAQFYPGHTWKKLRRRLSDLTEACGDVRDRDIAIELLGKAGVPDDALLLRKLQDERRAAGSELQRELKGWKGAHFQRHWSAELGL